MKEIQKTNTNDLILEGLTEKILKLKQQTAKNIIEIGNNLSTVKMMLPHGEFGKWLEEKVEYTQNTANKFMKIYETYSANYEATHNLGSEKLYLLTKLSKEDRENFILNNDVESMSTRELKENIKEIKDANKTVNKPNVNKDLKKAVDKYEKLKQEIQESQEEIKKLKEEILINQTSNDMKVEFEEYIANGILGETLYYRIFFIKCGVKQLVIKDYLASQFSQIDITNKLDNLIINLRLNKVLIQEEKDFIIGECLKFSPIAKQKEEEFFKRTQQKIKDDILDAINMKDIFSKSHEKLEKQQLIQELIQTGYKTLAKKYHPDLNGGDDKTMKLLNEIKDKFAN